MIEISCTGPSLSDPESKQAIPMLPRPGRFQPVALSIRETSSKMRKAVIGSTSSPPNAFGRHKR
jgi:hypothetical protein